MYVCRLRIALAGSRISDLAEEISLLLEALRMNGQICGREFAVEKRKSSCIATILVPEPAALSPEHNNLYVRDTLKRLEDNGAIVTHEPAMQELQYLGTCKCAHRTALVLYTSYTSLESPIRCIDCFGPIPLYRIPRLPGVGEYYDIVCWQSNYEDCDRLQMNCLVLEKQALGQLTKPRSTLSLQGRRICRWVSQTTNLPVYYYLQVAQDDAPAAKCPSCGRDGTAQNTSDVFRYRCDPCYLVF
jgi:predicted  nucleic acid-binding Zn ribbon protein